MASHASTPESVLQAPVQSPIVISEQTGPSRAERRRLVQWVDKSGSVDEVRSGFSRSFVPKAAQVPASNVPFTWADPEAAKVAQQAVMAADVAIHDRTVIRPTMLQRAKSLVTFGAGRRPAAPATGPAAPPTSAVTRRLRQRPSRRGA